MRRGAKRLSESFDASECEMLDGGAAVRLKGDGQFWLGFRRRRRGGASPSKSATQATCAHC